MEDRGNEMSITQSQHHQAGSSPKTVNIHGMRKELRKKIMNECNCNRLGCVSELFKSRAIDTYRSSETLGSEDLGAVRPHATISTRDFGVS